MKILTLRFANLNALYGKWTIDFTAAEYRGGAIFAITGATGAGKSTVLDAICLALYGQTPRLGNISKNHNEIISHGAGACYAEITFTAGGAVYTAHWSQRRAREKKDGALQLPRHEVATANGEILESKVSKTPGQVEQIIGLNFARFTRTVLLAQGQFAAFLEADAGERAPILEQITGTAVYSDISKAVHKRYSAEKERLQSLQAAFSGMPSPDNGQMSDLQSQIIQAQRDADTLQQHCHALQQLAQSYQKITELHREQVQMNALRQHAEAALEDFLPEQQRLQRHEKAFPAYHDYQLLLQQRTACSDRQQQITALQARLTQAKQALAPAEHAVRQAQQALAATRQAHRAGLERLARARAAEQTRTYLQQQYEFYRQRVEETIPDAATTINLNRENDSLECLLAGKSRSYYQQQWQESQLRRQETAEIMTLAETLDNLAVQQCDLEEKQAAAAVSRAEAALLCRQAKQRWQQAEQRCDDRRIIRDMAVKVAALENYRRQLTPGKPCPLCGATKHPYAENLPEYPDAESIYRRARTTAQNACNDYQRAEKALQDTDFANKRIIEASAQHNEAYRDCARQLTAQCHRLGLSPKKAVQAHRQAEKRLQDLMQLLSRIDVCIHQQAVRAFEAAKQALEDNRRQRQDMPEAADIDHYEKQLNTVLAAAEENRQQAEAKQRELMNMCETMQMHHQDLCRQQHHQQVLYQQRQQAFRDYLAAAGFADEADYHNALLSPETYQKLSRRKAQLSDVLRRHQQRCLDTEEKLHTVKQTLPADAPPPETVAQQLQTGDIARCQQQQLLGRLLAQQQEQQRLSALAAQQQAAISAQSKECRRWHLLHELIGSADGKKYRHFVQRLTFNNVLAHANQQLAQMTDRYWLMSADPATLSLDVVDYYQNAHVRTGKTLSGGEGFIVSLALALGLAQMSGQNIQIDSLFLDEGFGSLDDEALDSALNALAGLQESGKLIGIISHVDALKARISTQIQVHPGNHGISTLSGAGVKRG